MTYIISCFPGIGKTKFIEKYKEKYAIVDVDKILSDEKYATFLDCISDKTKQDVWDFILFTFSKERIKVLKSKDIEFISIFPEHFLQYEYIKRYLDNGIDLNEIDKLFSSWEDTLFEIETTHDNKIILTVDDYLEDAIPYLWFKK